MPNSDISVTLSGRELTTIEIRDALIPYLKSLLEEHGDVLVDVIEKFPDPPRKEKVVAAPSISNLNLNGKKLKAISRACELDSTGNLRPHILYLIELGLSLEQIKGITRRFPAFAYYSLERKVKPLVEFLLNLGVPKADIATILIKRPQLCGISLTENLIPTMVYLEKLGMDKRKWAKVINRFPALLTYSRQKFQTTLDFLLESGVSEDSIGKILTHCPSIMSYSVEEKLRPTTEYFRSMGVNVAFLLVRSPQTFGLSIESHLKPVTGFFLEKGYSLEEIKTMVSRHGSLYTFSLADNLVPKWEFYLTMDYPLLELVKFPQYFGYSLEQRIKPRYARLKSRGVKLLLNQLLSLTEQEFEKILDKKTKKALSGG